MDRWLWDLIDVQWSEAVILDAWVDGREFSLLRIYDSVYIEKLDQVAKKIEATLPPLPPAKLDLPKPPRKPPPPKFRYSPPSTLQHFGERMDRPNETTGNFAGLPDGGMQERHCNLTQDQWAAVERWNDEWQDDPPRRIAYARRRTRQKLDGPAPDQV